MKLVRKLAAVLVLLIVVCVFVVVSLVYFIDPNKLKPILAEETMKRTGYKLVIDGNLSWTFYPILGVKVEHMTLSAPNQSSPFVDLRGVIIATELWQLLHGNSQLQGDIRASKVNLMNFQAQNAHVVLHWQNNVLNLQPIVASVYGGSFEGTVQASNLSTVPRWSWDLKFDRIQLKPLLDDINGANSKLKISGIGQVKLKAETQGKGKDQLLNNLNGTSEFSLNNGVVEGIDLNYLVQSADAILSKKAVSLPANINQTTFDSLTGSAVIKNGIAKTDNLLLVSSAFTTRAQGDVDLVNQRLEFRLLTTPVHTIKLKWPVPVLVDGSFHNPSVRLDMLTLKTMLAKEEIEKVKAKVAEQIKELPDKADKILQKLLGR